MHSALSSDLCPTRQPDHARSKERGVHAVVALTATMMTIEIAAGYWGGSMALLADGWHMATHVAALGVASAAYAAARRYAGHHAFAFGTGKVHALAGYTSAVVLGLVALVMIGESVSRLLHPTAIDFASSLPVAILGLLVNLLSVYLLHDHEEHEDAHEHDHNHRAALMHVGADTLTSALAILALLAGRALGWTWLDPISGMIGGAVIAKWGFDLCRVAALELLDADMSFDLTQRIRSVVEQMEDARVSDLHVWPLGRGRRSCVVTVVAANPRDASEYRARILELGGLAHLTVEVQRCPHHAHGEADCAKHFPV